MPGANNLPSLVLEGVTRHFGRRAAVDGASLSVEKGETVCLLGPSGCGKTTTLRIAAGVEHADEGRVLIDGATMQDAAIFVPPEKRGVGLMFQDFALFPHLTILQNVAFGLRSFTRSEANAEALAALARVGLAHYANEYPHILSGGEQQRVALARAIAPRPSVLLMDEPFSVSTRDFGKKCARRRSPSCMRRVPPRSSLPTTPRRRCAWATAWR